MAELKGSMRRDEEKLNSSEVKSESSSSSYKNTLQHVKGTLIMYLRKTPIIDLSNEMLLKIIYSMMNFEKLEIT